jgi:hypothetical protein
MVVVYFSKHDVYMLFFTTSSVVACRNESRIITDQKGLIGINYIHCSWVPCYYYSCCRHVFHKCIYCRGGTMESHMFNIFFN